MFSYPSNSYYIICFFYCYQDHGVLAWFIRAPRFHLRAEQGTRILLGFLQIIHNFTVTYIKPPEVPNGFAMPHTYIFTFPWVTWVTTVHCTALFQNRFSEHTRFNYVLFYLSTMNSNPFLQKRHTEYISQYHLECFRQILSFCSIWEIFISFEEDTSHYQVK